MDIDHQIIVSDAALDFLEDLKEFPPISSDNCYVRTYLELPDVHDGLLLVRQC